MDELGIAPFDAAEYLGDDETIAAFLSEAFETGDKDDILRALGTVARAKGIGGLSESTGLGRESLFGALREGANPEFATILKVLAALGVRMRVGLPAGDIEAA